MNHNENSTLASITTRMESGSFLKNREPATGNCERLQTIEALHEFFLQHPGNIVCAYLYGSLARGDGHKGSDADIAVLYKQPPPSTLDGLGIDLSSQLEQLLHRPVDLIILSRAPVDLIHRILRDGILVYDGDPSARIRFEVKARNDYFDLLPYLREYRRATSGLQR